MIKFIATQYFWKQQKENIIAACFEEDDTVAAGCCSLPSSPQRFHHFTPFLLLCFFYLGCLSSHSSSPSPSHPCFSLTFPFISTPPSFGPSFPCLLRLFISFHPANFLLSSFFPLLSSFISAPSHSRLRSLPLFPFFHLLLSISTSSFAHHLPPSLLLLSIPSFHSLLPSLS